MELPTLTLLDIIGLVTYLSERTKAGLVNNVMPLNNVIKQLDLACQNNSSTTD